MDHNRKRKKYIKYRPKIGELMTQAYGNSQNIISYVRIVLLIIAAIFMAVDLVIGVLVCYFVNYILDFTGYMLADRSGDKNILNLALDMAVDRIADILILIEIGTMSSGYVLAVQIAIMLELLTHFLLITLAGIHKQSHKDLELSMPRIFNWYYTSHSGLFIICLLSNLGMFFMYIYLATRNNHIYILAYILLIGYVIKLILDLVYFFVLLKHLSHDGELLNVNQHQSMTTNDSEIGGNEESDEVVDPKNNPPHRTTKSGKNASGINSSNSNNV